MAQQSFWTWFFRLLFGRAAQPTPEPRADAPAPQPRQPDAAPTPGEPPPGVDEPPRDPAGTRDIDEESPRAPETPAPPAPPPPATPPVAPAPVVWTDGWNPAIPQERRLQSPNRRARGATKINRIVVHITGTADFASARDSFMSAARQASAHYCIDRNGDLYQFVSESDIAWHAGIHTAIDPVYSPRDGGWRKYKRHFGWHEGYPADAVFLNRQMQTCPREQAVLVARADGAPWRDYEYFDKRWGSKMEPVGYEISKAINQHSIGIETVGHGGKTAGAYTDAMYVTLASLVADICTRHNIPRKFGPVCGHEDVNPVERWGWDPGPGFNWSRVVEA